MNNIESGSTTDCTQAGALIEGLNAEALWADRGYDTDAVIAQASSQNMAIVIPPKKNRNSPREYDKALYKLRHLVKNAFLQLNMSVHGYGDIEHGDSDIKLSRLQQLADLFEIKLPELIRINEKAVLNLGCEQIDILPALKSEDSYCGCSTTG